jgi:Tfp pilus assembly protein PilO
MKLAQRKAAFTALILAAGVLLCGGLLLYQSKTTKLRSLSQTRNRKLEELRGLQAKLASRPVLERKYEDLQARLAVLEPTLATYAYIPTFLRQIEQLARDTDNKVSGVKPLPLIAQTPASPPAAEEGAGNQGAKPQAASPPAAQELYDRVPIEFSLEGDYWRTAEFIRRLSKFPKMLAIDDLSLTPTGQPQGLKAPDLRVKMTLLALIQKGEEKWTSDAKNSSS